MDMRQFMKRKSSKAYCERPFALHRHQLKKISKISTLSSWNNFWGLMDAL